MICSEISLFVSSVSNVVPWRVESPNIRIIKLELIRGKNHDVRLTERTNPFNGKLALSIAVEYSASCPG